jgi:iron complex outermembrane receptor protein
MRTFNANDFRPVLHSVYLRKAVRAALFGTSLGLTAVTPLSIAAETAQVSHHYAIPAGQLDDVLNQFARQAGITLSSTPQLTQGL